ncbi:hypothetical protein BD310DRAFT_395620 [Dichomitus squalens]|uniref:Uncharacterized protein n=2 Tax=Dichomitus squalens TaxID=114155 RepID=A0A4Q9Q9Z1_9APHY|nr:hypothetical protein BD310DRAFT_395620 [Dichomitus squalens]
MGKHSVTASRCISMKLTRARLRGPPCRRRNHLQFQEAQIGLTDLMRAMVAAATWHLEPKYDMTRPCPVAPRLGLAVLVFTGNSAAAFISRALLVVG